MSRRSELEYRLHVVESKINYLIRNNNELINCLHNLNNNFITIRLDHMRYVDDASSLQDKLNSSDVSVASMTYAKVQGSSEGLSTITKTIHDWCEEVEDLIDLQNSKIRNLKEERRSIINEINNLPEDE